MAQEADTADTDVMLQQRRLGLMKQGEGELGETLPITIREPKPRIHGDSHQSERPKKLHRVSEDSISNEMFYGEYHGHLVPHLKDIVRSLTVNGGRSVIYLCGDSSLDNKYWLPDSDRRPAINGYETVLVPPRMAPDIAYWLNHECVERGVGESICAVNASVEESTLADRAAGSLLPQDAFIRDHISEKDVLVVSVGGNDVALRPTLSTIVSIAALLCSPRWLIRSHWAPGFGHFIRMFRNDTQRLIETVIANRKPRCVVVCMYYYFDETSGGAWADAVLSKLGYDRDPTKLQLVMREIFAAATQAIQLEGIEVLPLPLYNVLDGKNSDDYEQRVEPSVQGGQKMARAIMDCILAAR